MNERLSSSGSATFPLTLSIGRPSLMCQRAKPQCCCAYTTLQTTFDDAKTTMRPDLPERHLERLDRSLSDYAAQNPRPCRSLLGWYSAAQEMQIKLAPEAVLFMGYVAAKSNATPAPVRNGASNAPMDGITTKQVAAIFDGFHYTAENW